MALAGVPETARELILGRRETISSIFGLPESWTCWKVRREIPNVSERPQIEESGRDAPRPWRSATIQP